MSKLFVFMMVSLDGYMEGENHDLSWHNVDSEFNNEFAIPQLKDVGRLLFGHRTYDLMHDYWPTPEARKNDPIVAELMNTIPKIVVSHSLQKVDDEEHWKNIRLMHNNVVEEVQKLKNESQEDIGVFGSNNLCVTLLENNLIDELRIMVNPVVIGHGTPLFKGIDKRYNFALQNSRQFNNGNVLLTYSIK